MIKHYKFGFARVLVNSENGEIRYFAKDIDEEKKYEVFLYQDRYFHSPCEELIYTQDSYEKVTLSLNLTTRCNLSCKYCFMDHKKGCQVTDYSKLKELIEQFVIRNKDKRKVFIDLSGSGEPLLRLNYILELARFAKSLKEKYKVEVVVQFVTNGTLLTSKVVKQLQSNAILFGVSLDGLKENHDKNRVTVSGHGTYDMIASNMAKIEEKRFLGSAMVLDGKFSSKLVECYENMKSLSSTVSIKFKRAETIDEYKNNFDYIIGEYFDLVLHLLKQISNDDYSLLHSILSGDDSFGTMLSRVFIDNKVFARCDAGLGRLSYDTKLKLYPCAPASAIKEFEGIEGLSNFVEVQEEDYCGDCECRYYCGGECPIVKYQLKSNDIYLCKIKRKLFEYALFFKSYCLMRKKDSVSKITDFIINKETI